MAEFLRIGLQLSFCDIIFKDCQHGGATATVFNFFKGIIFVVPAKFATTLKTLLPKNTIYSIPYPNLKMKE